MSAKGVVSFARLLYAGAVWIGPGVDVAVLNAFTAGEQPQAHCDYERMKAVNLVICFHRSLFNVLVPCFD
jgi:hypothetical protein